MRRKNHFLRNTLIAAAAFVFSLQAPLIQPIQRAEAFRPEKTKGTVTIRKRPRKTGKKAIKFLIQQLKSPDVETRAAAAELLGKIKSIAAIPALIDMAFHDKKRIVRLHALTNAKGIIKANRGKKGFGRSIPLLVNSLNSKNNNVLTASIILLSFYGKSAVPALAKVLKRGKQDLQITAIAALKRIGRPAVPALIEGTKSKDWSIRYACIQTLGKIGDKRALKYLRKIKAKDPYVQIRDEAGKAIRSILEKASKPKQNKDTKMQFFDIRSAG